MPLLWTLENGHGKRVNGGGVGGEVLWLRSELRTRRNVPRRSPWAPIAAGRTGVTELLVEAKSLVRKRTKLKLCPARRTGPRVQRLHPGEMAQRPAALPNPVTCAGICSSGPLLQVPTARKKNQWLSFPCHLCKLIFSPTHFSFLLTTYC